MLSSILLWRLLAGHLLGDFMLQPKRWVEEKNRNKIKSRYLPLHVLIQALLAWLMVWDWTAWWIFVSILLSHYAIDVSKTYIKKHKVTAFCVDQLGHLVVLVVVWLLFTNQQDPFCMVIEQILATPNCWIGLVVTLLLTKPTSTFITLFVTRWMPNTDGSLKKAGQSIGYIERLLILLFIFFNLFEAVGFLIAAKTILRFEGGRKHTNRKETEYVLIGTLISFGFAIFIGLVANYFMAS